MKRNTPSKVGVRDIINAPGLNYKDREVVHEMLAKIQRFIEKQSRAYANRKLPMNPK